MKITLTESEFVNRFRAIRPDQFSTEALRALFTHLEELERDCGEEVEFDPIALCCDWSDWSEYPSAIEAAEAYGWEDETEEGEERDSKAEDKALTFLCDNTTVLELNSGVLVLNY
jgi:hypothetical protein